ncbi:hypothetical protein DV735_g1417, partial [Chaetothyriales sp. CBS 134920]
MASAHSTEDGMFGQATESATATGAGSKTRPNGDTIPRPKRIACILCRKRKLKCDGNKPCCGTCSRLGHTCEYSEERKKSGPKRGYVKLLEARLKQVENLLETREGPATASTAQLPLPAVNENVPIAKEDELPMPAAHMATSLELNMMEGVVQNTFIDPSLTSLPTSLPEFGIGGSDNFAWEMIGLGLEEALPNRETVDELNRIYFEKIHPSMPMIHRGRFLASMDLPPHMRPCVALRYIMWAHACSATPQYSAQAEHFYTRARKYAENDEMRGHGESIISLAHCQAWILLSCYEFKMMYFPRAWMSTGRSARLALMMGLHRQDSIGLDVKQTLRPARDWLEREERKRTFWMAYCQDRYASIGTGWPMEFDERDIRTNLPATDDSFRTGQEEQTQTLAKVLNGEHTDTISSFTGVILLATIYGRNLTHLHRPTELDNDHDLNGEFWKRHRDLDNILLKISLSMPLALRPPAALSDPNAIFCNMNIQTATICLHQAAIFKAEKNRLPAQVSGESKRRCIVAADQITNVMKMVSHLDLSLMNPFLAFCLYIAARVFVQYLKARKDDSAVKSSLQFLLSAIQVLTTKNPLAESFLAQLDVDIEGSGLDLPSSFRNNFDRRMACEVPTGSDNVHCTPLVDIHELPPSGQANHEQIVNSTSHQTGTGSGMAQAKARQSNLPAHIGADTTFDGADILYNPPAPHQCQQSQNSRPSPGLQSGSNDSSASYSSFPTPASSSNRGGSHTGHSPYQYHNLSPSSSTSTNINNTNGNHKNPAPKANSSGTASPAFHEQLAFRSPGPVAGGEDIPNHTGSGGTSKTADEFPFPDVAGATSAGGGDAPATGMTPTPDMLWQSVMDAEGDWIQGWSPGIQ